MGQGDVNRPKLGAVAPPLDPLPVRGGDGCCFFAWGGIGSGRAMLLVSQSPNRIVSACRCDRLRCGRRMHRPYERAGFMVVVIRGIGRYAGLNERPRRDDRTSGGFGPCRRTVVV